MLAWHTTLGKLSTIFQRRLSSVLHTGRSTFDPAPAVIRYVVLPEFVKKVCITDFFKGPMYRVFGMNFLTDTSSDLILEDVWGTPGEGGAGLWKNMICKDEFKQVLEPGIEEKVMYFNLQEFVLHRESRKSLFSMPVGYY